MTSESRLTEDQPKTLGGILNTLSEYAGLVLVELKFRKGKRKELKGIIIDDRNTNYEDEVCEDLAKKLSEIGASPYKLGKWFSDKCVPQFNDSVLELPFNYLRDDDIRSEGDMNLSNFQILRYRVWEKLYDRVFTLHRADIIDIRRRFFDALLDSQ